MAIMQDNEKLDKILERYYNRFNKFNTKVLKKLGNAIKQFDGVSPSEAYRIAQELKYNNFEINDLLNELSQISGKSVEDIDKLFNEVAKENVNFAETYYKAKNKEFVKYEDNQELQNIVEAIKKETNNTFLNLSNSKNTGFVLKDEFGNKTFNTIPQVYNNIIDEAVYNVSIGVQDYQSAMRNTLRQLADSGVKIHEEKLGYKNGYNRRIDSSVRQDVLTGLRRINLDIQEQIGEELGTDGVEISAHSPCAEDHLHIQGQQFTKKQFERINGDLERPIGEYNCRHFVFSVILGVQSPSYSKKMLRNFKNESLAKVNYNGKTYTKYEATQVQRQLETAIRKQKDRQIIARASGNKEEIGLAQQKISQLTTEYNKFSQVAGLDTYKNRLSVSGYKRVSTK
jgi:hypothetical protein